MKPEHLEDMAKLYAPRAAVAIRNEYWEGATMILLERCRTLDMALQSLTPGGSEYVGDPERCVNHVKEILNRYRLRWLGERDKTKKDVAP